MIAHGAITSGLLAALAFLAPPTAAAPASRPATAPTTSTAPAPLPLLDPNRFAAYDRPSDDGSAVIVEWAKPLHEPEGISYVVEIAPSPDAFGTDRAKTVPVRPALKATNPKFFSALSASNRELYYAAVTPAAVFPPPAPGKFTAERIDKLLAARRLNAKQATRAKELLASKKPEAELSSREKRQRRWLGRLQAYISKSDARTLKARQREINGRTYYFRLAVTDGGRKAYVARGGTPVTVSAGGRANWIKHFRWNNLVFALTFSAVVMAFIHIARRNPNLFIRKIAGLEAVDEAIGRATEMGRPVFFVHGLGSMQELATIAAVNVLARVARRAADYDTRVRVMNYEPIVTAVSQEVVQQAYTEAGRPDAFDPDDVSLVATTQFSYVAAVSGRMIREQPAAVFMVGRFFAESLLLAETGASTGAIQVAGTDSYTQLPFFITTCDYTLIGEELYAASAYLSREPRMLGSLRGQDVGKAFLMIVIVVGALLLTLAGFFDVDLTLFRDLFKPLS